MTTAPARSTAVPSEQGATGNGAASGDPASQRPAVTLPTALSESQFLNRELSWLAFNERVLAEARDPRVPLLERLKFCAICGSNLDEFFMVRVAGIHRQIAAGVQIRSLDGLLPQESIELVRDHAYDMQRQIERALREVLKLLRREGIKMSRVADLGKRARQALREHYLTQIQPVLTPLVVDPSHPFPYLSNLSLNLGVLLADEEGPEFARVKVPVGVLPRIVEVAGHRLLLEDVIGAHLTELFRGRTVLSSFVFRVTRNTDYEFDEEEAEDLLATIEDGLRRRRFGAAVRLEIERDMTPNLRELLRERLHLSERDVFELEGPLGVADFMGVKAEGQPDLRYPPYAPHVPDLEGEEDLFATLRAGDVLLHHPYDSFEAVLRFLERAAADPDVLAIKQTLYRTGDDPRLLRALKTAAESGKQVVALVEIKARFDEQRNISWARELERVGAHVVYGMSGLKTHAKVALVVRREAGGLRRYLHIGTGNYNPKTARLYTDLSVLTADPVIGEDVAGLFNHLTGYAEAQYQRLLVAPDTARSGFYRLIGREAANARAGKPAWIRAKLNQLTDPGMIEALYAASQAGVQVRLMVRGVCCLRPGVPGLSENIQVRSLLGRYLEHARLYAFANGGEGEVFYGSADWMSRNLDRRVEVIAPACSAAHQAYLLNLMDTEWQDTCGAWELGPDGRYLKLAGEVSAQGSFMRAHGHQG